jgi:hypothetical protein
MSIIKTTSTLLSVLGATLVLTGIGANKAQALSEVSLPSTIMIKSAHSNMVVDKFGDNPSVAANAHLYSQENPATFTLRPIRSANGSYETQLASSPNLCFTAAGGLNPNMGNGTQAVFSGDCNNSLNLRFFDDGTVRIGRNTNMCLTNQGNRFNSPFNKLHWWACDNSPETKWNFPGVSNVTSSYDFKTPYVAPVQNPTPKPVNTNSYVQPEQKVQQTSKEEMWKTLFGFAFDLINKGAKKTFAGIAKDWLWDCAMSETCLAGQNIRGGEIYIPEDKVYQAIGYCFNPLSTSQSIAANKSVAVYLSKKTGFPIVYSYYYPKAKSFVFGVPK